MYKEQLEEKNKKLDEKAEKNAKEFILEFIKANMNRSYFDEDRADLFFEKVFAFDPKYLLEDKDFKNFIDNDLLLIMRSTTYPETIMNWSKFINYVKIDDPYAWSVISNKTEDKINQFHIDQLLAILVNMAHSLSSETPKLFRIATMHFCKKMNREEASLNNFTVFKEDDVVKIMTVFGAFDYIEQELVDSVLQYIKDNQIFLKFDSLADLLVVFAIKCNETHQSMFLKENDDRIMSNIMYTNDEVFYKFFWSYSRIGINNEATRDQFMYSFIKNHIDFKDKMFIKTLVLLTKSVPKENLVRVYNSIESDLMKRMEKMKVEELVDLMWWLIQADIDNDIIYSSLQKELQLRMSAMKDEEILILLSCFTDSKSGVEIGTLNDSKVEEEKQKNIEKILDQMMTKLLGTVVKVVSQKIKKFQLRTLIGIVWTLSRLNLQADDKVILLFTEIKAEIMKRSSELSEKSIAMLLWCYSRQEYPDKEFIEILKKSVKNLNQPSYDNFDLMLIVQACKLFEGSHLKDDNDFMSTTMDMLSYLESFVTKEIKKMNIHEFMTVTTFYLLRNIGTTNTITVFKNMIVEHIDEFNQVQLALLISALKANTLEDHTYLINTLTSKIEENNEDDELPDIDEEKLRLLIRERLKKMVAEKENKEEVEGKLGIKTGRSAKDQESYFDIPVSRHNKQTSKVKEDKKESEASHKTKVDKKEEPPIDEKEEPIIDEKQILRDKIKYVFGMDAKTQVKQPIENKEQQAQEIKEKPKTKSGEILKEYLIKKKKDQTKDKI